MKRKPYAAIWVFVLIGLYIAFRLFSSGQQDKIVVTNKQSTVSLDRSRRLVLTKHAKCRMECRDITLQEIKEIVKDGDINTTKSDLSNNNPKYALEGNSSDGQHIRVIIAPEKQKLIVVSCIDLDKEWECDCR